MLSITTDMSERQGLNSEKWYEAKVIENDDRKHPDKMMLGRIQARVAILFDGIKDEDLPWAVPMWNHVDGASDTSGLFAVPKKKTKVFLRFQLGNASFPMYRGYHTDVITQMEEVKLHYPNRAVARFQNKALIVVDTEDNVAYIRNPGNLKIYIDGNVQIEVTGDVDELVHGSVRREIKGNFHDTVLGVRHIFTGMAKVETTLGPVHEFSSGTKTVESSGGNVHIEGKKIYENSGKALNVPVPPLRPKMGKWPGIPGGDKGTNTRGKPSKQTASTQAAETSGEASTPNTAPDNSNIPNEASASAIAALIAFLGSTTT